MTRFLRLMLLFAIFFVLAVPFVALAQSIPTPANPRRISVATLQDGRYFVATAPVTVYVATTGNDTFGSGTSGQPYASVQRALDDIPQGYTANVIIRVGAGTFTGTTKWVLHAMRGDSDASVYIQGDCTTPQVVFSTTGAGAAATANSVTLLSAVTFATPLAASGTIPVTTLDGDYFFTQVSTTAATLGVNTGTRPAMAATVSKLTLPIGGVTTAIATLTPKLCPWASIFSGAVTVTAPTDVAGGNTVVVSGVKFSGTLVSRGATITSWLAGSNNVVEEGALVGAYVTGTTAVVSSIDQAASVSISYFNAGVLSVMGSGTVTSNVFIGSVGSGAFLSVGPTSVTTVPGAGGSNVSQFYLNDFNGTAAFALEVSGNSTVTTNGVAITGSCTNATAALNVTGAGVQVEKGGRFTVGCSGGVTGKYTATNVVKTAGGVITNSLWSAVNTSSAGTDWTVGALAVVATASLPVLDVLSGSSASVTGAGPTSVALGGVAVTTGAGLNKVAVSDASGNLSWTSVAPMYAATGNNIIPVATAYYSLVAPVTRYVDPTNGSDTLCDGTASASSASAPTCAWASEQRALDDIPDGYGAVVQHIWPAGTTSSSQTWNLRASRGVTGSVSVVGDCTTPQATFTTTGTGVANVVSATNSIASLTRTTFTPTVATGSIPNPVVIGTLWFRREATAAASLGVPSSSVAVLDATATGTTIVYPNGLSTTAIATGNPKLCPFATIFSGTVTASNTGGTTGALRLIGLRFTGNTTITGATILSSAFDGSGKNISFTNSTSSGNYFANGSFVQANFDLSSLSTITNSVFNSAPLSVVGSPSAIQQNYFTGTQPSTNYGMVTIGIGDLTNRMGGTFVANFNKNDYFGTGAGVIVNGGGVTSQGSTGCSNGGMAAFDTLGVSTRPVILLDNAVWDGFCGLVTGTSQTLGPAVVSGSRMLTANWGMTGPGTTFQVGGSSVDVSSFPFMDYGTGSFVSSTTSGPSNVPKTQGGFGVAAATTQTSCTLNGATPAVCTATVPATCVTAACMTSRQTAGLTSPACAVSGTTATITGGTADTSVVNILCF